MSAAPWAKSSAPGSFQVSQVGATATSWNAAVSVKAATRSPGRNALSRGASRTTPATSAPRTNGGSCLNWYSPRVSRTSGKATPAAWTSTTTPGWPSSGWTSPGSGTSTSAIASGPSRAWTCRARTVGMARRYSSSRGVRKPTHDRPPPASRAPHDVRPGTPDDDPCLPLRILVADDDPLTRRVLSVVLTRLGHDVVVAQDGEEAWAAFEARPPEVVITDWMMPGLDGPVLVRRI